MSLVGQSIGRYHIVEQLGQGGMATVYKGFDTRLERYVAIKVIRREAVSSEASEQMLKRFERESKALAKMSHPNIVKVHDYGEYQGSPYLVMEYIAGGTLKLVGGNPMPYREAAATLVPVARALSYAHEQMIVHRDIKPSNILLTESGIPMLSDFGIAKILQSEGTTNLTGTGVGIGTPEYMAPEQGIGQNVDHRADIYALGVVFYELVTGRKPFYADTPLAVVFKHITDPLPSPRQFVSSLPEMVEQVIFKALAKKPEDRYQTMGQFAAALEILATSSVPETAGVRTTTTQPPEIRTIPVPSQPAAVVRPTVIGPPPTGSQPAPVAQPARQPAAVQSHPAPPSYPSLPYIQPAAAPKKRSTWLIAGLFGGGALLLIGALVVGAALIYFFFPVATPVAARTATAGQVDYTARANTSTPVTPTTRPGTTQAPTARPTLPPTLVSTAAPTRIPTVSGSLQTLRIQLTAPDTIDPHKGTNSNEVAHMKLVFEGLTRLDNNLVTVPAAAERWEYNSNATQLTFTLRRDLVYSDGVLLNAKRFEYAILRNMDPTLAGDYSGITDEITGAYEYRNSDPKKVSAAELQRLRSAVQVQALDVAGKPCTGYDQKDCLTLRIGLKQPVNYFHTVLGLWAAYPVREELVTRGGELWWQKPELYIGNGAFILKSYNGQDGSSLTPNPAYWRGAPRFNLYLRYMNNLTDALAAYRNNDLDITTVYTGDLANIRGDAVLSKELVQFSGFCSYAVVYHQQKPPFDDQRVRSAFSMAIDRDAYVREQNGGLGYSTLTWIPRGFPGYDSNEKRWGYNPDAARKALTDSKYGSAAKLPEVVATYLNNARNQSRWEWFAARWKSVLGVNVRLNPVDAATWSKLSQDPKASPQMYFAGWCADFADPQNWLSTYWRTGSGFGVRYGYSNADLDKLLMAADGTLDYNKRMALYAEAQSVLVGSAPATFLYNSMNVFLVKPWVKGQVQTSMDNDWPGSNDPLLITINK